MLEAALFNMLKYCFQQGMEMTEILDALVKASQEAGKSLKSEEEDLLRYESSQVYLLLQNLRSERQEDPNQDDEF